MKLSDMFEIMYPKTLIYSDMIPDKNGINFVSSQGKNNGIVGRVQEVDGIKIYPKGCITVPLKGSVLMAHLQPQKCYVAHQIAVLLPKKSMSIQEKLYYVTLIRHNSYKYNYGRQADKTIGDIYIPNGEIYNTDRTKSLRYDIITTHNRYSQRPLNIDSWQEFKVGDYFDVYLSSGDLKIDECELGNIPLVSSGTTNNGIVGYIDEKGDGKAQIFKANSITVDMFCNAFYQNNDYYAVSHGRVNILYPKFKCNPLIGCFICSVINNERFKYSYGRAVYSDEISRMVIKLPTTSGNVPDFNFMENYIKSLPYGDRI